MKLKQGDSAPVFSFTDQNGNQRSLNEILKEGEIVLYFLRYIGCPVCQYEILNLTQEKELITSRNAQVIVVLQSTVDNVKDYGVVTEFPFIIACDPEGKIFDLYGVDTGNLINYISGFPKGLKVIFSGMKHGKFEGKEMQLPADFLIDQQGVIKFVHYGRNPGDSTSIGRILN